MSELRTGILEMINHLGEDVDNLLSNAMSNLQFRIDVDAVSHRIQDYIDLDRGSVERRVAKDIIITSPTQVGKTNYIIKNCKKNKNRPFMFLLTCDNSKAQMKQLKNRLLDNGIVAHDLSSATKSKVEAILRDGKSVFIVMLNNETQVKKLNVLVNSIRVTRRPKQYIVFHDEADMINKADARAESGVAASHKRWVSFFDFLASRNEIVKRFWVTATPENCSSISGITGDDIIVLPVPEEYVGITENVNWTESDPDNALGFEIKRIQELNNGEIILYCLDRKKAAQDLIAREISFNHSCIAFSYNGDGFLFYKNGDPLILDVNCSDDISSVLDKLRGCGPVVVVGYNLMNRGISFVAGPNTGNYFDNCVPTATVMFYAGGKSSHIVGLAQRFGRICGTSRPDITRRVLYCSSDVYSDYVGYLTNQKIVFGLLKNGGTMAQILMESEDAVKLKLPLDRPALKNVNVEYRAGCNGGGGNGGIGGNGGSGGGSVEWDEDKMHRLVDSWKNVENSTAVARLFRRILGAGGKMDSGLVREYFSSSGAYEALTSKHMSRQNLVFRKDSRYHYIRNEVLEYLN
jgi:hypothetical protein